MAIRCIALSGVAPVGDTIYHDKLLAPQTVLAGAFDSVHATIAAAITASSSGDQWVFTEAGNYGTLTTSLTNLEVYVKDTERWSFSEVANGVVLTGIRHNGLGALICDVYISGTGTTGMQISGSAYRVMSNFRGIRAFTFWFPASYYNCIHVTDYELAQQSFLGSECHYCLAWFYGTVFTGNEAGFQSCNVQGCMSFGFDTGDCFKLSTAIGVGANMSSDATALGSTNWQNIVPADVLVDVTPPTLDAHWIDKTTAENFIGPDLSADYNGDLDNELRSLWSIGPDDFPAGGGGGGGSGGALAAKADDDAFYFGLV